MTKGPLEVYYEFQCSKHAISLVGEPAFTHSPIGWQISTSGMQCLIREEGSDCTEWWETIVVMHTHQP